MSHVRVKHRGQVTIPVEIRERFKLREGSVLEVEVQKDGIFLKPATRLRAGEVVGEDAYKKILEELEIMRKKWR